jgi:hypothetical protein
LEADRALGLFSEHHSPDLLSPAGKQSPCRERCTAGWFPDPGGFALMGTSLLISAWLQLILAVIYQSAMHGLILSEGRLCWENYGQGYWTSWQHTPGCQ